MHASESRLGNGITESYLASFAHGNPGFIFKNYGTVGIGEPTRFRVLSGVPILEVLAYLLPLCNEDTSPVTPALTFSGCDKSPQNFFQKFSFFLLV
ncbi:hypothetical protein HanRHA438_Chr08g0366711 [Helianthus annuus]|nr:hypothetical protein HanHA300_Chr08g0292711 [Helianthus annuus]KAJ0548334.1 hypothetical protein HanIR_Chr08g0382591 [Helianthus annuus]KAJ0554701.1 hypothetical protein HanHA89_Chr08g0311191 [Helianthus annuus]KAJ0720265.1 hypothetical protein HanLR1_Chr08g0291501 [Helianthus annuus]KAJ0899280.1 hypothetical protein HanRHA438_Chr08g0366711 [Helianthus annuus]